MSVCCVYDEGFFEGLEGLEVVSSHPEDENVAVNVGECVSEMTFSPFSQKVRPCGKF